MLASPSSPRCHDRWRRVCLGWLFIVAALVQLQQLQTRTQGGHYKFIGNDGLANTDDNLMPWENATYSYLVGRATGHIISRRLSVSFWVTLARIESGSQLFLKMSSLPQRVKS